MKWKVLFTTQTEKKNIKQQYHTCKRVYLRKLELFPTSQWCPQIEFSHPAKVLLTLGGINKITHIPQERHGKCCPVKTDFFFLYMAIIRKRNKLTTLIWKKLNSEAKSCVNRQNPTVGKYQLDNQEIGTCIFIFESCFFFFKNIAVWHSLQKESNMNKEGKGEHIFWKPESFILYLFKEHNFS